MISIYADGADLSQLKLLMDNPIVDGVTTNPSLVKRAGARDLRAFAKDVLAITGTRPVSFEICADEPGEMLAQAREIASWGENVYVKLPITRTNGEPTMALIDTLPDVHWNITAIFTIEQMVMAAATLYGAAPSIISVFAGRIADTGRDPVELIKDGLIEIKPYRTQQKVLWASTREVFNICQAEEAGCDIITLAPELIDKMKLFGKDLNEYSLETVKQFHRDAAGVKV